CPWRPTLTSAPGRVIPWRGRRAAKGQARVGGRDRALPWLTGAVIAAALVAVVLPPVLLDSDIRGVPPWFVPVHVVMAAAAGAAGLRGRVGAATAGTSWTAAAILLCVVSLPAGWVGPVVLAGVFLGKLLGRVRPYRALFNASKDALSAT